MDLLTNGIESIQVGIEDYRNGTPRRLLSAIRNIHAGILLLYKEGLRRHSPAGSDEALIKAKIAPSRDQDGNVTFIGKGKKTVRADQIQERFERLGIATDWARFWSISKIRNDVEHYYTTVTPEGLKSVIADAFVIVRNFVADELNDDPRDLMGEATWQAMLQVHDVYAAEKAQCDRLLNEIDWKSSALSEAVLGLNCSFCGSGLLRPEPPTGRYSEIKLVCRNCGGTVDAETFIPKAIEEGLASESYGVKDGGEIPYVSCPSCLEDAYVVEEERCALCGYHADHVCSRCGNEIPPEEISDSSLCGWCAHQESKDD